MTAMQARTCEAASVRNPLKMTFLGIIRGYQMFISPALPRSCKYHPTCSQYALDALHQFGVARGLVLATWRLLRCNPLSYGGYDPVEAQKLFRPRHGPMRLATSRADALSKREVGGGVTP